MTTRVEYRSFASTRPFGVEMEVTKAVSKEAIAQVILAEDPLRPCKVTEWEKTIVGDGWHVKKDSTCGFEVASYKASGFMDIANMGNVADALKKNGVAVSDKCGLHVHAELIDHSMSMAGILMGYWVKIEPIVLQACPMHRRNNMHCRYMRDKFQVERIRTRDGEEFYMRLEPTDLGDHHNNEKRVTLNFVPYAIRLRKEEFKKCTAEIRFPEGTLNGEDVVNWVRFYLHFVESTKGRRFPSNLSVSNLDETLEILGLNGPPGVFYLLNKDLFETKKWFLKRIVQYTNSRDLYEEALKKLNGMTQPEEVHYRTRKNFNVKPAFVPLLKA